MRIIVKSNSIGTFMSISILIVKIFMEKIHYLCVLFNMRNFLPVFFMYRISVMLYKLSYHGINRKQRTEVLKCGSLVLKITFMFLILIKNLETVTL